MLEIFSVELTRLTAMAKPCSSRKQVFWSVGPTVSGSSDCCALGALAGLPHLDFLVAFALARLLVIQCFDYSWQAIILNF